MFTRRDSIVRKRRRFLLPFFQFSAPAIVFMIALPMVEDAICKLLLSQAPTATCMPIIPSVVWVAIYALILLGIFLSAKRFYRDHICGEVYLDHH